MAPHIHCLISEGGYSDNDFWRNTNYFNYSYLRNTFRTALLNEMESKIGPSFKKVKPRCYREHKDGFQSMLKHVAQLAGNCRCHDSDGMGTQRRL